MGLILPKNIGRRLCIDETAISDGELYTMVSNPECRGRKGSLVTLIKRIASGNVIKTLQFIPQHIRNIVREVTMDLSDSMNLIYAGAFLKPSRTTNHFHVQKTCL